MELRTCRGCQRSLALADFFRDASKPLGRRYRCKDCERTGPARRVFVDPDGHKICRRCMTLHPTSAFSRHSRAGDGLQSWCRDCQNANRAARYRVHKDEENERHRRAHHQNPDKQLDRTLRKRYGITLVEFERMQNDQGGRCLICDEIPRRWNVDHCHATQRVRGLLCSRCNTLVGFIENGSGLVERAQDYITAFGKRAI